MKNGPASSPIERLLRLGSLVGRVGASMAVEQLLSLVRSGPSRQAHQVANLVFNAERIVHDLGVLQPEEHGTGLVLLPRLEVAQALELALLFLVGRAEQLYLSSAAPGR